MYLRGDVLNVEEWKFIDLFVGCHWYILQSLAVVFRPYIWINCSQIKKNNKIGLSNLFTRSACQKTRRCRFHYNLTHTQKQKEDTMISNNNYNF